MRTFIFILLTLSAIFLNSCKERSHLCLDSEQCIIGTWINPEYDDNLIFLSYSNELKKNKYGISFLNDGTLSERKNAGFCGTPPITYENFDGTWEMENSILNIDVEYWGGRSLYTWEIISMDSKSLTVKRLDETYISSEKSDL